MIYCKVCGGLGNQLFQIFAIISYAIDTNTNYTFIFANLGYRNTYWDNLLKSISIYLINDEPSNLIKYEEKSFNYNKIENNTNENIYNHQFLDVN